MCVACGHMCMYGCSHVCGFLLMLGMFSPGLYSTLLEGVPLLHSSGLPVAHSVDQANLKLIESHLPLPPECRDYKQLSSLLAFYLDSGDLNPEPYGWGISALSTKPSSPFPEWYQLGNKTLHFHSWVSTDSEFMSTRQGGWACEELLDTPTCGTARSALSKAGSCCSERGELCQLWLLLSEDY